MKQQEVQLTRQPNILRDLLVDLVAFVTMLCLLAYFFFPLFLMRKVVLLEARTDELTKKIQVLENFN